MLGGKESREEGVDRQALMAKRAEALATHRHLPLSLCEKSGGMLSSSMMGASATTSDEQARRQVPKADWLVEGNKPMAPLTSQGSSPA